LPSPRFRKICSCSHCLFRYDRQFVYFATSGIRVFLCKCPLLLLIRHFRHSCFRPRLASPSKELSIQWIGMYSCYLDLLVETFAALKLIVKPGLVPYAFCCLLCLLQCSLSTSPPEYDRVGLPALCFPYRGCPQEADAGCRPHALQGEDEPSARRVPPCPARVSTPGFL
jgi:hypothetical protein